MFGVWTADVGVDGGDGVREVLHVGNGTEFVAMVYD